MLVEENQISFHSDDGTDDVQDYSHLIAEMIGLTSDTEFHQAGVSLAFMMNVFSFWFLSLSFEGLAFVELLSIFLNSNYSYLRS